MLNLLWLVPALPLAGFLALVFLSGLRLPKWAVAAIGTGSVGASAAVTLAVSAGFLLAPPAGGAIIQPLWTWFRAGGFAPAISLRLDALSLVMIVVITFVGFLIHLYSAESMREEEKFGRFFAFMNLFVASMLILVLADDLLALYLGWEGVGLCSFLLIGFWYREPANGAAARKAFLVTRVGDTALAIGLLLIFTGLGTLNIQDAMVQAAAAWPVGSAAAAAAAALLLGGAVGKSAQLPLQIWLPDAMAGPTPVSALIHAATMVTAGVYLIARTHALFSLAPAVLAAVAVIGAATLLLAGLSALVQRDIKRILAYSTMSQIGYMFLALGVGAWSAAIFHFATHAFFKALLFLAAGAVIAALDEEHDIFKMGGLRRELPLVFWTFLAGAASLAALPLVTAGFYSKDEILRDAFAAGSAGPWLWAAGLFGALLTGLYTFRLVFVVFGGDRGALVDQSKPLRGPGWRMTLPLVVLAVFSLAAGFVNLPQDWGLPAFLGTFLAGVFPAGISAAVPDWRILELAAAGASLLGLLLAYIFYSRWRSATKALAESPVGNPVRRFWFAGWGFDWLADRLIVRPYVWLAAADKGDFLDAPFRWIGRAGEAAWRTLSLTQNGSIAWYALAIVLGAAVFAAAAVIR